MTNPRLAPSVGEGKYVGEGKNHTFFLKTMSHFQIHWTVRRSRWCIPSSIHTVYVIPTGDQGHPQKKLFSILFTPPIYFPPLLTGPGSGFHRVPGGSKWATCRFRPRGKSWWQCKFNLIRVISPSQNEMALWACCDGGGGGYGTGGSRISKWGGGGGGTVVIVWRTFAAFSAVKTQTDFLFIIDVQTYCFKHKQKHAHFENCS